MAGDDPTQTGGFVRVDLPARERKFLQELIALALDGVREELASHGDAHPKLVDLRREEAAYERLLEGLAGGRLATGADVRAILAELGEVIDASNEYARVVFEHKALQGLLAILEGSP
ncbi:MAG TPA: hypothetical protein VG898_04575 [Solirubrobacterales bacterium]|nr:hypothetical protein [Solirubrobacterales bacterium]